MIGNLVTSLAGHDKGHVYIIVKVENDYCFLCDGHLRKMTTPKKKKLKHVQLIKKEYDSILKNRICSNDCTIRDEEIKRAIKLYIKSL